MAMQTGLWASYLKKMFISAGIGYIGWSLMRNSGFSDPTSRQIPATKKLSTQKTENLDGKLDQDNKSKLIAEMMSKSVYNEATKKLMTQKTEDIDGKLDQERMEKLIAKKLSKVVYNEVSQPFDMQNYMSIVLSEEIETDIHSKHNYMFSPLLVHAILCRMALGSRMETRVKLHQFLNLKEHDHSFSIPLQLNSLLNELSQMGGGAIFKFEDSIWFQKGIDLNPAMVDFMENDFNVKFYEVDFLNDVSAREEINFWIRRALYGCIHEHLPHPADDVDMSVDASTTLLFANVIFLKANWEREFDRNETKNKIFYLFNGGSVMSPFMTAKEKQYIGVFEGYKVLRLPYRQGTEKTKLALYIILPDEKDGLIPVLRGIHEDNGFWNKMDQLPKRAVKEFWIPKFMFRYEFDISGALKAHGWDKKILLRVDHLDLFQGWMQSYSHLANILQCSTIFVDEEGIEISSAATAALATSGWDSLHPEEINFVADHPFMFLVRDDKSKAVLLLGVLNNPRQC